MVQSTVTLTIPLGIIHLRVIVPTLSMNLISLFTLQPIIRHLRRPPTLGIHNRLPIHLTQRDRNTTPIMDGSTQKIYLQVYKP